MKKLILYTIISFAGICLNAQTKLDSLYSVWKDDTSFTFESRGKIEAKGKGEIEMYFVSKN